MIAVLITILLTPQGDLVRQPIDKPMASIAECRLYAARQDFFPPPAGALAAFYYCEAS